MTDGIHPNDPDWVNYIHYSKELTAHDMAIREKVVNEYLYDYSWTKACLRCGFRAEFCEDNAKRFAQDPYCIWRVKELSRFRGLNPNPEQRAETLELEKIDILNALRKEAHYYGPGSSQAARVSALGKLAQLLGMEPPKAVKAEVKAKGVMVVPGIASVDDWEQVAQQAQADLQEATMNGVSSQNVH